MNVRLTYLKKPLLFFALYFINNVFIIAQEPQVWKALEKQADSIYFDETDFKFNRESQDKLMALRQRILSMQDDTTSVAFKTANYKKLATQALLKLERFEYGDAIIFSEKALKIIEELEHPDLVFEGYINRALYHQYAYSGDWEKAYDLTLETRKIFKDTLPHNHKLVADVEFDIGFVASQFGDIETVIKQYEIAAEKYVSFLGENAYHVALKYQHLAFVYGTIGYFKKELEYYLKSAKVWEAIDHQDKSYLAIVYGSLAVWYQEHGDIEKAEQYLIKRQNLVENYKNKGGLWYNETYGGRTAVETYQDHASIALMKKDTVTALHYNDKILNLLENYDSNDSDNNPNNIDPSEINRWIHTTKMLTLRSRARLFKSKSPKQTKALYEQSLGMKNRFDLNLVPLEEYLYLADYHLSKNDLKKSREILNQGLSLKYPRPVVAYDSINLFAGLARVDKAEGNIEALQDSYRIVFKKLQIDPEIDVSLAKLDYNQCKPYGSIAIINIVKQAAQHFQWAYKQNENQDYLQIAYNLAKLGCEMFTENNMQLEYNDASYQRISELNEIFLEIALQMETRPSELEILRIIEKSQSRIGWKQFLGSIGKVNLNVPDSVLYKEKRLYAALHYYKKSLYINNDGNALKNSTWKDKILRTKKELDTLSQWYQINYPRYYQQIQKDFDVTMVQDKLSSKQRIIKYYVADSKLYAFVLSKDDVKIYTIGNKDHVLPEIEALLKELERPKTTTSVNYLSSIYSKLLDAIHLDEPKDLSLIFVMDDILHLLPMEILKNARGDYLIENYAVSYSPSIRLWVAQIENPVSNSLQVGVFLPFEDSKNRSYDAINTLIKGTSSESNTISSLFDATLFRGDAFSKNSFFKDAKDFDILHLAMHAQLNTDRGDFSYLDFSKTNKSEKLYVSELYGSQLNADLVVLSACNTGRGNLKKGEGTSTISKAFTYAGVPSVVSSLWDIPDNKTAVLMGSFYTHLKEGQHKDRALQLAKLDYLRNTKDSNLQNPYFWAGFVVSGNTLPINNNNSYTWIWMLFGVLCVTGLGVWLYKNHFNNSSKDRASSAL